MGVFKAPSFFFFFKIEEWCHDEEGLMVTKMSGGGYGDVRERGM